MFCFERKAKRWDTNTGTAEISEKGKVITVTGLYYVSFPIALTAGETYYVDFKHTTDGGNYGIRFEYVDNSISETLTNPFVFVPEKDVVSIYLYSSTGEEKTVIYEDVQVCEGNTALPWEEFSGGIPSPNPEYPQEINSLENPEVAVCGSNLIPFPYAEGTSKTMNGITFTVNDDGSITVDGTASALAFFTFNYSGNKIPLPSGWISTSTGIGYGTGIAQIQNDIYVEGEFSTSIQTATKGASKRLFEGKIELGASRLKVDAGVTVDNVVVYPMLCHSENVLPYDKGKTRQEILLPHTLHGIPVTSGGNYTDADGQKWICDEVDLERGVLVKRCGSYIFDGSDDEAWNGIYTHDSKKYVYIKVPRGSIQYTTPLFCNYAKMGAWSSSNVCFINNYAEFVVGGSALATVLTSVADFRKHIAENPIMLVYVLETPVETALTDEEIEAFKAIHSNFPNTTIMNDAGAHIAVKYGIDTKTYIDKKFEELKKTILGEN